jgi:hypothetical protein
MKRSVQREFRFDAPESKTPSTSGNSQHGNRETPGTSTPESAASGPSGGERLGKVRDRAPNTHVSGESDVSIVPKKRMNKASPTVAAESVEGRGATKGNATQTAADRTQRRETVSFGLWGVRQAARRFAVTHPR